MCESIGDTSGAVTELGTGLVARYTGTSLLALKGDPTTGPAFVLHLFFCIIHSLLLRQSIFSASLNITPNASHQNL